MSVTTAPPSRRYHRDQNGLEIEFLQDFDPTKSYRHYIEQGTKGDVMRITTFCGTTRAPIAEDFLGPRSDDRLVCPRCYFESMLRS